MKRFFTLLAVVFSAVMVACSSDPTGIDDAQTALKLTGRIYSLTQVTKANASGFEANDQVGVYIVSDDSLKNSGNYFDNVAYKYGVSGSTLTPPSGNKVYWPNSNSRLDVYAYYPYNQSISAVSRYPFSVQTDQSIAANHYASDFLWASASNLAPRETAVNMAFSHKLSKVNITLVAGSGFDSDELVAAQKTFSIVGTAVNGWIDLATGIATVGSTKNAITPLYNNELGYTAVVYPQTTQIIFKVEIDGEVYAYTTDASYEPGYQYNYTLTLSKPNKLQLTINNVVAWEDGNDESGEMEQIITGLSPKFKAYLVTEKLYTYTYDSVVRVTTYGEKIDANGDGEISYAEAEKVEYISFRGDNNNREELTGLEFFPNLEYLGVLYTSNTTLDFSNNPKLIYLICYNNQLTSLDVSKNTALTELICFSNQLTSLDVSKNTALTTLECYINQLTMLDVSKNTALTELRCHNNSLTTLDVSKNTALTELSCTDNQLTSLDVSNNTALTLLRCNNNSLTTLDVSKNTALKSLYCCNTQLTTLDVSKNTALTMLICSDNQLTTLDVSNNTALRTLDCNPMNDANGDNMLTKLYLATGQSITTLFKPDATEIEYK